MINHFKTMAWHHEPPSWRIESDVLHVRTGLKTDFWQTTYYGFARDNGHFLGMAWEGEFSASVRFSGSYQDLYDQAGLMVRADPLHWLKCGIEFTDGAPHLSVVATNGQSDWSAQRLADDVGELSIRVTRLGDALFVQYSLDHAAWRMARLASFPVKPASVLVGPMACSPEREGFEVSFHGFEVGSPTSRDIH